MNDIDASSSTPLEDDEVEGLIPDHLTTRAQLNEWEQLNITEARLWAFGRAGPDPLTIDGLRSLNARMFGRTWKWAGTFRTTDKNIGVPAARIWPALRDCIDDARWWIEHDRMPLREAAARYHHRLVQVHPFPNGNGRWARLAIDLLLHGRGEQLFEWGRDLETTDQARAAYMAALRSADRGEYGPLIAFLRIERDP